MSAPAAVPFPSRFELASWMISRLRAAEEDAARRFRTPGRIPSFYVDDLLPAEVAQRIYNAFPAPGGLELKKTIGQLKFVGYQLEKYDPLVTEAIYAFQDLRVVALISSITGIGRLTPDEDLYAGGISMMTEGHFLNPHLDNSHDKDRKNFRVLNLLYYVTPAWDEQCGGNLELWDSGPGTQRRTLHSRFNRLVVMQTDERSWHAVSEVRCAGKRCCVSNYYFSDRAAGSDASYHVTSFRGWPEQKFGDFVMRADNAARLLVRKLGGNWLFKNPHVYKKKK